MSRSLQWSRLPSTPSPSVDNRSLRSRDPSHFWNPQKPIHQGNWSAPFNQPSVKAKLSHPPPPSSLTPVPLQSPHHRLYWFQFPPPARVKGVGEWASFNHWYTARGGIMTPPPPTFILWHWGGYYIQVKPPHTRINCMNGLDLLCPSTLVASDWPSQGAIQHQHGALWVESGGSWQRNNKLFKETTTRAGWGWEYLCGGVYETVWDIPAD